MRFGLVHLDVHSAPHIDIGYCLIVNHGITLRLQKSS